MARCYYDVYGNYRCRRSYGWFGLLALLILPIAFLLLCLARRKRSVRYTNQPTFGMTPHAPHDGGQYNANVSQVPPTFGEKPYDSNMNNNGGGYYGNSVTQPQQAYTGTGPLQYGPQSGGIGRDVEANNHTGSEQFSAPAGPPPGHTEGSYAPPPGPPPAYIGGQNSAGYAPPAGPPPGRA